MGRTTEGSIGRAPVERHLLIITKSAARLGCGPAIDAYFQMESKALNPSGVGKIDVALRLENVTCPRCIARNAAKSE